jgi:hypothetical protein
MLARALTAARTRESLAPSALLKRLDPRCCDQHWRGERMNTPYNFAPSS